MGPKRDGIRLATDIHLPARDGRIADGPFSVVLECTPTTTPLANNCPEGAFRAQGGYAVNQDSRDRFDSEGAFPPRPAAGPMHATDNFWFAVTRFFS